MTIFCMCPMASVAGWRWQGGITRTPRSPRQAVARHSCGSTRGTTAFVDHKLRQHLERIHRRVCVVQDFRLSEMNFPKTPLPVPVRCASTRLFVNVNTTDATTGVRRHCYCPLRIHTPYMRTPFVRKNGFTLQASISRVSISRASISRVSRPSAYRATSTSTMASMRSSSEAAAWMPSMRARARS